MKNEFGLQQEWGKWCVERNREYLLRETDAGRSRMVCGFWQASHLFPFYLYFSSPPSFRISRLFNVHPVEHGWQRPPKIEISFCLSNTNRASRRSHNFLMICEMREREKCGNCAADKELGRKREKIGEKTHRNGSPVIVRRLKANRWIVEKCDQWWIIEFYSDEWRWSRHLFIHNLSVNFVMHELNRSGSEPGGFHSPRRDTTHCHCHELRCTRKFIFYSKSIADETPDDDVHT